MVAERTDYLALVKSHPELFANPPGAAFKIVLEEAEIRQAEADMAARLHDANLPREWAKVGVVFRDQYLILLRDAVRYTDGSLGTYIRVINPFTAFEGVVILPVWQRQILLIRHFRHATRQWHLEIPRGFGSHEDPEEDARHELLEEIGAVGARLVNLGKMYPDTGIGNARISLFYAEVTTYGKPESIEGITEILPTPVPEFEQLIRQGALDDGYVLAAFARAKVHNLI